MTIAFIPYPGNEELVAELGKMQKRMTDFSPAWPAVMRAFAIHEADVFESEGLGNWAPLADSTILRKSYQYAGALIEERDGTLAASFSEAGMEKIASTMSITMGSNLEYALYQDLGYPSHADQPGRDLTHLTITEAETFTRILAAYVFEGTGAAVGLAAGL